jgi:exopolyphosphatase / guanosine-5'-triphosphate,3'-diphosphate pyrophosphatase
MQKLAIIDLGTNTFHLLIADWKVDRYFITYRDKQAVKLGQGGINQDIIQEDALERALRAMTGFQSIILEEGITKIYAFATSALRHARNAEAVVGRIKEATGIEIDIISGEKEAEYIYYGVRTAVALNDHPVLIIDIGGGSVEFIIGNHNTVFWKRSYEIGGQRLLEKFHKSNPIAPSEINALNNYLAVSLGDLFISLKKFNPHTLIGASGTFDTLSDIHCIRNAIVKNDYDPETPLTIESFQAIYHDLIHKTRAERLQIPGMIEMRVDMIVVACCLIRFILGQHDFQTIRVSSYALKEGVLASLSLKESRQ